MTIDTSAASMEAVDTGLPQVIIIFDRFHVQKLAFDALDQVRRLTVTKLDGAEEARAIKGTRFTLLKYPCDLKRTEVQGRPSVNARTVRSTEPT